MNTDQYNEEGSGYQERDTARGLIDGPSQVTIIINPITESYNIGQLIGEGVYGNMHVCHNKATGRKRAVEILTREGIKEEFNKQVIAELELLKALNHPNIRNIYEVFIDINKIYIITELCTGGELLDVIQERASFTEKEMVNIMDQILRGISYCHGQGLIHRDLRPENILLERKDASIGQVKLINFRTSMQMDDKKKDASTPQ